MIIKRLHIENFGKLSNFDLEFNKELNEVYKENGWGKSTLTSFIKAMFYSMTAKARGEEFKYERTRFAPWQGGNYGGYLEYQADGKNYRVTRYFEKTPEGDYFELKDLETNKIVTYEDERLGDSLFGLGKDSFEVTALFPQLNFLSTSTVQITANLTGLNKFQNDMENLNKAVKILDSKMASLKKEKPNKDEKDSIKRNIIENETFILEEKSRQENLLNSLKKVKEEENDLIVIQNEEIKELDTLTTSFNKKIELQDEIAKENEKLNQTLIVSNQLKDQKLENRDKNKNKRVTYFIPIPFAMLIIILFAFTLANKIQLWIGISTIIILAIVAVVADVIIIKLKSDKSLKESIKELDRKIKDNEEQSKLVLKNVDSLNQQLKALGDIVAPDRRKLDEIEGRLTEIKLERVAIENEIVNITESIDRIIEINEKLQNDYDLLNEKNSQIDKKLSILQSTRDYLIDAKENVSSRFVVPVNEKLKTILSKFKVSGREFVVDTSWKVKENTNFGTKDFEYSSQGFQDIISFCQRINLIQDVYQKEKPMIILDDTFVNLDDHNMAIAKQIVREISKYYQVLYICCNERCSITK